MKRMDSGNPDEQAFHQMNTRKKSKESGQAAVEMALMLPLLLLLIFGMLEMGWLATTRQTMDAITREATRAGAALFRAMDDPRMAERADDLLDLERQVLIELSGEAPPPPGPTPLGPG